MKKNQTIHNKGNVFLPKIICQCTDKSLMSKYKSLEVDINNNFKVFEIREDFSVIQPPRAHVRGSEKVPKNTPMKNLVKSYKSTNSSNMTSDGAVKPIVLCGTIVSRLTAKTYHEYSGGRYAFGSDSPDISACLTFLIFLRTE